METIRVNMTPCEDVKTIHASQNDGEAREWGFELHNNGEKIDSSSISDQMVFKSYENGTEEILPTNGSTPTTSPIIADIKYPQGLLTDQEFTYRQSPTEEDGYAKIETIYGNTLGWNQQIPIPTRQSGASSGVTVTNNGDGSLTLNGTPSNKNINWWIWGNYATNVSILSLKASHKYFVKDCNLYRETGAQLLTQYIGASPVIWSPSADYELGGVRVADGETSKTYTNAKVYPMLIDLTQMGLDITASEFTSLFPLPYYAYNQGTLLSFNGNGIKTVGKNQFNSEHAISATSVVESNVNGTITIKDVSSAAWSNTYIGYSDVITGKEYTFKALLKYGRIGGNLSSTSYPVPDNQPNTNIGNLIFVAVTSAIPSRTFIPNFTGRIYWWYCTDIQNANHQRFTMQPMLSTTDADFEPYTSSTLSLPISTYFPSGMDGVGTAYDEHTNSGYAKRMGQVDLSSLPWVLINNDYWQCRTGVSNMKLPGNNTNPINGICDKFAMMGGYYVQANGQIGVGTNGFINCNNGSTTDTPSGKLYYELTTPLENYGVIDLGTLTWSRETGTDQGHTFVRFRASVPNIKSSPSGRSVEGLLCTDPKYYLATTSVDYTYWKNTTSEIFMYDSAYATGADFKQAMSGVYLLYEKENPQGFTTASLVTENAEIPLSAENDVLIGKCTEELSSKPGFIDAKIKLTDGDGTCYSNKIQLHVERKP